MWLLKERKLAVFRYYKDSRWLNASIPSALKNSMGEYIRAAVSRDTIFQSLDLVSAP